MIRIDNPIFISGHTRSGTNLLMRLMDGAAGVIFPPGEGKINVLRRFLAGADIENQKPQSFDDLVANIELNLPPASDANVHAILRRKLAQYDGRPIGLFGILTLFLETFAEYKSLDTVTSDVRWLEKNHNLEFYWGRARSLFGSPKLLYVARDPLDNWASWKKYCEQNGLENSIAQTRLNIGTHLANELVEMSFGIDRFESAEHLADYYRIKASATPQLLRFLNPKLRWSAPDDAVIDIHAFPGIATPEGRFAWNYRMMYEKAASLAVRYPDNVMIVRYEDMVRDTKACMAAVLRFCGLPMTDINLLPTDNGEAWVGNSSFRSKAAHQGVDAASVGRGQKDLAADEIQNIRQVLASVAA